MTDQRAIHMQVQKVLREIQSAPVPCVPRRIIGIPHECMAEAGEMAAR